MKMTNFCNLLRQFRKDFLYFERSFIAILQNWSQLENGKCHKKAIRTKITEFVFHLAALIAVNVYKEILMPEFAKQSLCDSGK